MLPLIIHLPSSETESCMSARRSGSGDGTCCEAFFVAMHMMHGPVSGCYKWNDGNRMQGELPSLQGAPHLKNLHVIDISQQYRWAASLCFICFLIDSMCDRTIEPDRSFLVLLQQKFHLTLVAGCTGTGC